MWTETAHYILLFATAAIGLEALILLPTLWSKGSAVAIRLGYRGACFAVALLAFSFGILMSRYVANDFSLAVVFENFSSETSPYYALTACFASREGLFFVYILMLSAVSIVLFNARDLSTYQERGRYLFFISALLFMLLVLMISTANPFARISDPPLEGLGLPPAWLRPYKTLKILASFSAYALLTATFAKTVSMYSKGWHFAYPALLESLTALMFLIFSVGLELSTRFYVAEDNELWLWSPSSALQLSVLFLLAAQILFLYINQTSRTFAGWTIFTSVCALALFSAEFFAAEYGLLELKSDEPYFPNPVIASCATLGITCFFLFFSSSLRRKQDEDTGFSFFSRESFIGLSAVSCLIPGAGIGFLSFAALLFLFEPDPPLRLLPDLLENMMRYNFILFSAFLALAFRRKSVISGWVVPKKATAAVFWSVTAIAALFYLYAGDGNFDVLLWSLPALILFWSILDALNFGIRPLPQTFGDVFAKIKNISAQSWGFFFCGLGLLTLSFSLSTAALQSSETVATLAPGKSVEAADFKISLETLTPKNVSAAARFLLHVKNKNETLPALTSGKNDFSWQTDPLSFKAVYFNLKTTQILRVKQIEEKSVTVRVKNYPALVYVRNALFFIEFGILLLLLTWRRRKTA